MSPPAAHMHTSAQPQHLGPRRHRRVDFDGVAGHQTRAHPRASVHTLLEHIHVPWSTLVGAHPRASVHTLLAHIHMPPTR
eukprot:363592-Chlamydomonas_euryale.AAC.8